MKLPVVLIAEDNLALVSLRQQLEKEVDFLVENKVCSFEKAFELLGTKTGPVLAVFDLSRDPERAFRIAQEIKLKHSHIHLVMTSPDNNPQIILRAMRSGAEEFFIQPFNWPEVLQSLEGIREKINLQLASSVEHGRIITVFSNKGGVGSTTVATNLAVELATQRQNSVCIVDLVLQFGSVTNFLNLEPSYTILDLVKNLKRIDPLFLDGSLVKHASGVRVLAEPFHAEDASGIKPSEIDQILETLVRSFHLVIVDSPKDFDETVSLALDRANLILFVTEMDVPSLKSAHRALELFDRMGIYQKKIRLVLNRYVKSRLMSLESVEKTLGIKVFWTLPNDYPTAIAALNQGLSLQETDPKSGLAKSYQGLAHAVMQALTGRKPSPGQTPDGDAKNQGILTRWISNSFFNSKSMGPGEVVPGAAKNYQGLGGEAIATRPATTARGQEEYRKKSSPSKFEGVGSIPASLSKAGPNSMAPRFVEDIIHTLSETMGPIASVVVRDQIKALGESLETFPQERIPELVELVSQEILDESLKARFQQRMLKEIRAAKAV